MLPLFIVDNLPTSVGSHYTLAGDDGHHGARVLRIQTGEQLLLTDGQGSWSRTQVLEVGKKTLELSVVETGFEEALSTTITVVQALPKSDRAKEAIELMTQAGADQIVLWNAERSIGKAEKGVDKLRVVAHEASKQSRRFRIPRIDGVSSTAEVVALVKAADLAIVLHEESTVKLSTLFPTQHNISSAVIVVGPEGGLTDTEIAFFTQAGAHICLLGRPILRSAHAGIAAISALNTGLKIW